ncbi:MAG: hypothetical protein EOO70_08075, partial [Myxococcaceae bacterium]
MEASVSGRLAFKVLTSLGELARGAKLLFRALLLAAGTSREESFHAEALERDAAFALARIRRGELRLATDARATLEYFEAMLALSPANPDSLG